MQRNNIREAQLKNSSVLCWFWSTKAETGEYNSFFQMIIELNLFWVFFKGDCGVQITSLAKASYF